MRLLSAALLLLALAACGEDGEATPPGDARASDAGPIGPDAAVLDTPANTWTWVAFPGTTCGNGSPAGIAINRAAAGEKLFVYFQGGGACWSGDTCFVAKTSIHIEDTLDGAAVVREAAMLDTLRGAALPETTAVYVPYCTGDLHAGARRTEYAVGGAMRAVHHTGATNVDRFVERLAATLPGATTVWLSGSSAGGYGATLDFHRFAQAWPDAQVHLLQDSAPFVPPMREFEMWQSAWDVQYPPGCPTCATDFGAVIDAIATAHPTSRIGLLHYDNDAVIRAYFGYAASLVPASNALLDAHYGAANTRAFMLAGGGHTMFGGLATIMHPSGTTLAAWFLQWLNGDPAWTTLR